MLVAWLTARTDKTTVTELLRIGWRTVGSVIERVTGEGRATRDLLSGLRRIGIDEISYPEPSPGLRGSLSADSETPRRA